MKKLVVLFFVFVSFYQIKAQINLIENLSSHVYFLADDKLEGRGTGSAGEKIAQEYISSYYSEYGLTAKGENGFIQPFDFKLGKKLVNDNYLSIGKTAFKIEDDYFPLVYSANGSVNAKIVNVGFGIDAGALYNDYKDKIKLEGKVFVINMSSPDGIHPHSKYKNYTDYNIRITTAKKYGAVAVVFYNTDKHVDDPNFDIKRNVQNVELPTLFIQRTKNDLLKDNENIILSINMEIDNRTGENVIAYIDNKAENTVIIGAHYDHLGWGEDGGSLYKGKPAIHNGADDNASGTSMILELARFLKNSDYKNNNYLFISFSAEELGLIGSKSFLLKPTIDISKINYMINLDMVGRLNPTTKKLSVGGVGTSSVFKSKISNETINNIEIVTKQSGLGSSDHSSFYLKDIPVLFLFTGTHKDYHKPSDDAWKVNYNGMKSIFDYTTSLIGDLNNVGKLDFQKTKDSSKPSGKRKFSVTLGIVPDYMFDGKGMKIDGVSDGKPASKGGIITGDIVIKMGSYEIGDMMAYMNTLGKFKKGDKTIVQVLRNNEIKKFNITF